MMLLLCHAANCGEKSDAFLVKDFELSCTKRCFLCREAKNLEIKLHYFMLPHSENCGRFLNLVSPNDVLFCSQGIFELTAASAQSKF
jgi:hypothetical protein